MNYTEKLLEAYNNKQLAEQAYYDMRLKKIVDLKNHISSYKEMMNDIINNANFATKKTDFFEDLKRSDALKADAIHHKLGLIYNHPDEPYCLGILGGGAFGDIAVVYSSELGIKITREKNLCYEYDYYDDLIFDDHLYSNAIRFLNDFKDNINDFSNSFYGELDNYIETCNDRYNEVHSIKTSESKNNTKKGR